ncbi:MAG: hypothetical protein ABJC09_07985 [Terriglobia bacterium]
MSRDKGERSQFVGDIAHLGQGSRALIRLTMHDSMVFSLAAGIFCGGKDRGRASRNPLNPSLLLDAFSEPAWSGGEKSENAG